MPVNIRKPLRKVVPFLRAAKTDGLNEADTVMRLVKVFEEVLGYDTMEDISREANLKGKFVDVILKVDGVIRLLVEAKAASETLRDRHIDQAKGYAANNGYRWVLLTNGLEWILYHLTFDEGIEYERAFEVNLSTDDGLDDAADKLALLHRQSIKKDELEEFWDKSRALSPASIARALFREDVLALIRREIRKQEGMLIDPEDLAVSIQGMLSAEARELIGPVRIRKRQQTRAKRASTTDAPAPDATAGAHPPAVAHPAAPTGADSGKHVATDHSADTSAATRTNDQGAK